MPWIESHTELWEHHKTIKLMRLLGISDLLAFAHLHSLWHFTLRNAWRDANLEPWGEEGIEAAARWRGNSGEMVAALRESGFLDGYVVHGWLKRAGELVKERFRNERRRIERASRDEAAASTVVLPGSEAGSTATTVPYRTVPNPTVPNPNKGQAARAPSFKAPTLEEVSAYCAERGGKVDAPKWFDYYTSNGWKVGRNPMKDWRACVRNWEKTTFGAAKTTGGIKAAPGKYDNVGGRKA